MSEFDRAPTIRLQIDQEVFQDAVRDGDEIDDATVATEVTSLERVGDAYVLEGAIVFAGYINRTAAVGRDAQSQAPVGIGEARVQDSGQSVNGSALHNRLPFVLRVPVKSQPRGLVNVASRISSWQLSSVSSGWIRVVADLSIVGLSGAHGYHFECGSQEYGDVLFQRDDLAQSVEADVSQDDVDTAEPDHEYATDEALNQEVDETARELDLQLARGSQDNDVTQAGGTPGGDEGLAAAENISRARGGAEGASTESLRSGHGAGGDTAQRELASLDKAYGSAVRDEEPRVVAGHKAQKKQDSKSNVVEFDFEHQVSPQELRESSVQREPVSAEFRGGTDGVEENDETTGVESGQATGAQTDEDEATSVIMRGSAAETTDGSVISSELWSFVDFNSPEQYYTMRYVIVSEEENLESIADRVGVLKSDLMRANQISEEVVQAGQALAVPGRPVIPLDL